MKPIIALFVGISLYSQAFSQASTNPIKMKQSDKFKTPRRHEILSPLQYGEKGILQVSSKGIKSFNFQWFSNNLKLMKEKKVEPKSKLSEHANSPSFVKIGNKTYLFVRDVYRDRKTEGVSCLEFNAEKLSFEGRSKKLFESSDKVRGGFSFMGFGLAISDESFEDNSKISFGPYKMDISKNEKTALFTYRLRPEKTSDRESYDHLGMFLFDQDMNKLWGGEMKMPYTEAKMDNLSFIVSDDGKVYMLAKVYEGETPRDKRDKKLPNYHLELLIWSKDKTTPDIVQIKLNNLVPKTVNLFETEKGDILLGGFYAKSLPQPIDGAYVLQLNKNEKTTSILNGGIFEIPSELIKENISNAEIRRLERKEKRDSEGDIGVENLRIRTIHVIEGGRIILTAEDYHVEVTTYTTYSKYGSSTRTKYDTYARDIYVINATPDGKSWVKKIPKNQHSNDAYGAQLSYNTIFAKDHLYVLYTDNKKNMHLTPKQVPSRHEQGRGGYLACVSFDNDGNMQKHLLGEIGDFNTNFFIRRFVKGDLDNLLYTARRKRKNSMIDIQVK